MCRVEGECGLSALHPESLTSSPPDPRDAWGHDLPGVVSLWWPHWAVVSQPYSPGSFHHHGACAFKLSKTRANENKENDLLAVIYIVNLLCSDFFPSLACSNLLRKIK